MNRTAILISILLIFFAEKISCQVEGVKFHNISLIQAFDVARKENKLVMVSCSSWNAYSQRLHEWILSQKKIGDYFNQNFICIKVDMQGPAKNDIVQNYKVTTYPTLVFINYSGTLVHIFNDNMSEDQILEAAQQANDPERNMYALSQKYKQGIVNFDIINNELKNCQNDCEKLIEIYFKSNDTIQWTNSDSWKIFKNHIPITSSYFRFFLRDTIERLYKKEYESVIVKKFKDFYNLEKTVQAKNVLIKYFDSFNTRYSAKAILESEATQTISKIKKEQFNQDTWLNFFRIAENLNSYYNNAGYHYIQRLSNRIYEKKEIRHLTKLILSINHSLSPTMCEYLKLKEAENMLLEKNLSTKKVKEFDTLVTQILSTNLINEYDLNNLTGAILEHQQKELLTIAEKVSQLALLKPQHFYYQNYAIVCERLGKYDMALKSMEAALELAIKTQPEEIQYYQNCIERFKSKQTFF